MAGNPQYSTKVAREIGAARIVAEVPLSDGSTALDILNFRKTEVGTLESRFRVMPTINPGVVSGNGIPDAFSTTGPLGIGYMDWNGSVPELLFLCADGCYRYTPWLRDASTPTANGMLEEQLFYTGVDFTTASVAPQGKTFFPPQMETIGNRIYFTFCDGGGAWVWDRERLRPFGFTQRPVGPAAQGPQAGGDDVDEANSAGFSSAGRIGTIESDWTREDTGVAYTVGGLDEGEYVYYMALEGPDGAYSATSTKGGVVTLRKELADIPAGSSTPYPEKLRKRFRLQNITMPFGSAAGILLRTANLRRLPPGDEGRPRFLHRMPASNQKEWIDDIPDSELGAPWIDRETTPIGFYLLKSFGGSLFLARTEGAPSRVWWSEQGAATGPTPESILAGHWRDVYPNTGAITALHSAYLDNGSQGPTLLVFKEAACHYITGEYPAWGVGTLHEQAGCAGPGCIQSLPDGSVVWYGNGTFWRMDRSGGVQDIGGPVRKRLGRVNQATARIGVSFVKMDTREAFFFLPVGESTDANYAFIWDWEYNGFRFHDQMDAVTCARTLPGTDLTLVGGTYDGDGNLWSWDRSAYMGDSDNSRAGWLGVNPAVYQSGWVPLDDSGVKNSYHVRAVVVAAQHAYEGTATVASYRNYDRRASTITEASAAFTLASPQDDTIVFWSDTDADFVAESPAVDDAVYPEAAPYYCRLRVDATDTDVFSVRVTVTAGQVLDLIGITAYANRVADGGTRAERMPE